MRLSEINTKKQSQGQIKTLCPLCSHTRKPENRKTDCLQVNLDSGLWNCWNCEEKGILDEYKRNPKLHDTTLKVYTKPEKAPEETHILPPEVQEFFKNRGISEEVVARNKVAWGKSFLKTDVDGKKALEFGLRFPFFEKGTLVNVKSRWFRLDCEDCVKGTCKLHKDFRVVSDAKKIPFGWDNLQGARKAVIVEGELDALALETAGIPYVISVPIGAKYLDWLDLEGVGETLSKMDSLLVAGDMDEDGLHMREELVRRLSAAFGVDKVRVVEWAEDCKDANEVLIRFGPELVRSSIENAQPVPVDGIVEVFSLIGEFLDYYDTGPDRGISPGLVTLEPHYRVLPGNLSVWTGRPGSGKSEVLDQIIANLAKEQDWTIAVFSPENWPVKEHMRKLAQKYIGKPFDKKLPTAMTRDEALQAAQWIDEHFVYIMSPEKSFNVAEILERARILVYRRGIKGLLIDPWNNVVKTDRLQGQREDEYISDKLLDIKNFLRDHGVHGWLVAHPKTMYRNREGKYEVPGPMDISGGAQFSNHADFIVAVERDPQEAFDYGIHRVTVHIQKVRHITAGSFGQVTLVWNKHNGQVTDDVDNPRMVPSLPPVAEVTEAGPAKQAWAF